MKEHLAPLTKLPTIPASAFAPPDTIWGVLAQKWGVKQF